MNQRSQSEGWTSFETPLGICGIAWVGASVSRFRLPEASQRSLAAAMGAPSLNPFPEWLKSVMTRIERHLGGEPQHYGDVSLSLEGLSPFYRTVYDAARRIHPGEVVTYGELAARIGRPKAARAVGQAMGRNPIPLIIPCHRVVGVNRNLGGFSAHGGIATKRRLLEIEGILISARV